MTRIGKVLTFSNVIACIALFVALGGSVYAAGKISGRQIKPDSTPGNRIKVATLTGKQIKPDSLTSKQIQESSLTGVSAGSLASVQYVAVKIVLGEGPNTGIASCPAGTNVIGGGAIVSSENDAYVNDSGPSVSRMGWTATGYAAGPGVDMTVTAICTAVTSTSG